MPKVVNIFNIRFKALSVLTVLGAVVLGVNLFSIRVSAASVTTIVPESYWEDAVMLYGPSGGGMPGAGSVSGWDVDFNPSPVWSNGSPGASAYINIPECVTSDIEINLSLNYKQLLNENINSTGIGIFIGNTNLSLFTAPSVSGASTEYQSGNLTASATVTRSQIDEAPVIVMIGTDNVDTYHWIISNRLATVTYDNSSCPVVATDPDISTTPSSTPVTINVLGNDTGTGLSVSKIDGQDVVAGQTITLTNGSGTVTLNNDGTITFTPAAGFTGESMFSYSITDGASTVDTGVVRITVAAGTTLAQTGDNSYQTLVLATIFSVIGSVILMNSKLRENN